MDTTKKQNKSLLGSRQATARLRYLHIAPRKVRLVADLIRGLPAQEAEAQLLLSANRASTPLLKLIRSAVANAKNNLNLEEQKLFIKELRVDGGPKLKRWIPRARGTATPIHKQMSHITVVLAELEEPVKSRFVMPPTEAQKKEQKRKIQRKKSTKQDEDESATPRDRQDREQVSEPKKEFKPASGPGIIRRVFRRKSM